MGVIQNAFNQMLGVGAIALNTVGKEMAQTESKAKESVRKIAESTSNLNNTMTEATREASEIRSAKENTENDIRATKDALKYVDKRTKAGKAAVANLQNLIAQQREQNFGFDERIDILRGKVRDAELNQINALSENATLKHRTKFGYLKEKSLNKKLGDISVEGKQAYENMAKYVEKLGGKK
jgi:chromosome segregation ATPase